MSRAAPHRRPPAIPESVRSWDDPRISGYRNLTDSALRQAFESQEGLFVVEGALTVRQMMAADWAVRSLLLLDSKLEEMGEVVAWATDLGAPVYVASRQVIDGVAGFPVHRGVLGLGERRPPVEPATVLADGRLVVVVEGVNNHENLGAIFRNAAAFGADGVLMDTSTCDPLYRRSVRVSMGHVLTVPFARLAPWPDSLRALTRFGYSVVALSPGASDDMGSLAGRPAQTGDRRGDATGADRVAVMVGAEEPGLSSEARAAADHVVRIPMAPGVDSLNVATAVALALYHFVQLRNRAAPST